jgi:lipoprotein-releasing system ATP-binding protein
MSDDAQKILEEAFREHPMAWDSRLRMGTRLKSSPRVVAAVALDDVERTVSTQRAPTLDFKLPPSLGSHSLNAPCRLKAIDVYKSYRKGGASIPVLNGLSMEVRHGEFLAIIGQSGSGKSTLLHMLGTLDVPDEGEIHFDGHRIDNLPAAGRDILRNRHFGMIFQFYHLLPELNALDNVLMPLLIDSGVCRYLMKKRKFRDKAMQLLDMVGLSHRLKHKPRELSGGEMQRAAIARSLIAEPDLLLADEPTGNLDKDTGREIIRLLRDLNERQNLTIVMVTHDQSIAAVADRTVRLADGQIEK